MSPDIRGADHRQWTGLVFAMNGVGTMGVALQC
jgi:hypothetical protein